ncbi:MAG: hypothetical protein K6F58_06115 [Bacteroidales bacterium]|nr:hypothetical protein [Bacteroidales bacterium]
MKKHLPLFLLILSVLVSGCKPSENADSGKKSNHKLPAVPSEIRFTKMDMEGVEAIAIMKTVNGKPLTKAGDAPVDRVCVIDSEGNVELASFDLYADVEDTTWRKVVKSITLVPRSLSPITGNYLHLDDVEAVCEWTEPEEEEEAHEVTIVMGDPADSVSVAENVVITDRQYIIDMVTPIINSLHGGYILRLSDGALFRSQYELLPHEYTEIRESSDGKKIAIVLDGVVILSDEGNHLDFIHTDFNFADGQPWGFFRLDDDTMVFLPSDNAQSSLEGVWSFDFTLTPYYLDYSDEFKSFLSGYSWKSSMCLSGGRGGYLLYTSGKTFTLYRIKKRCGHP